MKPAGLDGTRPALPAGTVSLPGRPVTPLAAVARRLLDHGCGLDLTERPAADSELGRPASEAAGPVIAVLRGDELLSPAGPNAARLARGDRLILVSARDQASGTAVHP